MLEWRWNWACTLETLWQAVLHHFSGAWNFRFTCPVSVKGFCYIWYLQSSFSLSSDHIATLETTLQLILVDWWNHAKSLVHYCWKYQAILFPVHKTLFLPLDYTSSWILPNIWKRFFILTFPIGITPGWFFLSLFLHSYLPYKNQSDVKCCFSHVTLRFNSHLKFLKYLNLTLEWNFVIVVLWCSSGWLLIRGILPPSFWMLELYATYYSK